MSELEAFVAIVRREQGACHQALMRELGMTFEQATVVGMRGVCVGVLDYDGVLSPVRLWLPAEQRP